MSRQPITTTKDGIRKVVTISDITLDSIYVGDFQKEGTKTAQLRQVVTTKTYYPSKKVDSSMNDTLFAVAEFGFGEQEFTNEENRVAWILVPTATTEGELKKRLIDTNEAGGVIYKVMANHPILDENQRFALTNPAMEVTMDTFANSQVVRYPDTHDTLAGQICLDGNDKVQYRRTFFSKAPKADQDARTVDSADVYMSPEILIELNGASAVTVNGQPILADQTL